MVLSPEGQERALNEIKKREEQTKLDMKDPNSPLGKITSRLLGTIQPQNNNQNSNNQWMNNLTNIAKTVQNGNNNYKKYNPNATNTQQQTSTQQQQQGIMSNKMAPTNPGNSNYNGLGNAINNTSNGSNTNQQQDSRHSYINPIPSQKEFHLDLSNPNVQNLLSSWKEQLPSNGNSGNKANTQQPSTYGIKDNWNAQRVNIKAPDPSDETTSGVTNNGSQQTNIQNGTSDSADTNEPIQLKEFVTYGGSGNNTAYFNPTMATTYAPSYTKKEESYGTYDTGLGKQQGYAAMVGSLGGKTDSNGNYIDYLEQIAKGVEVPQGPSSNVTNAYSNLDDTLEKMAGSSNISASPDSGYISQKGSNTDKTLEQMAEAANVQTSPDAGYRERNIQEGYTSEDLNKMAENGVGQLKDAYNTALNKAAANYNRLGLRGSGFEMADEFGNQSDSITSNYLKNVQQLQNDIDTKGLEAAREDRYKNADANEVNRQFWSQFGNNVGQQNFGNLATLAKLQQGLSDSDESSRQFWSNYDTNLSQQNWNNLGQLAGIQEGFAKDQNANELDWGKLRTSVGQSNIGNIQDAVKLYEGALGQSHGQQIDWGNLNGGLAAKDWEAIKGIWETAIKNDQFTAEQKNEILKTILASIATGTAGSNENFNGMINQFGQYAPYVQEMMGAAGYPVQQS